MSGLHRWCAQIERLFGGDKHKTEVNFVIALEKKRVKTKIQANPYSFRYAVHQSQVNYILGSLLFPV
jgi:hypothetical protein